MRGVATYLTLTHLHSAAINLCWWQYAALHRLILTDERIPCVDLLTGLIHTTDIAIDPSTRCFLPQDSLRSDHFSSRGQTGEPLVQPKRHSLL